MADRRYTLSNAADNDLEQLYDRGIDEYGLKAADAYYDGLIARFHAIAETPLQWQAVDHIRAGYRRSVYRAHSIYYRVDGDVALIIRILGRQDPKSQLPEH